MMGAVLYVYQQIYGLLFILFLMGTQSAFFGPVKYSILPLMLKPRDLYQANALVEAGTFIAILGGLFLSAFIFNINQADFLLPLCIILFSVLGYYSSKQIPTIKEPQIKQIKTIDLNIINQFKFQYQLLKQKNNRLTLVLAISWFWFIGATYLTQLPAYVKIQLNSESSVYSLLLILFALGIGLGSLSSRLGYKYFNLKTISLLGLSGLALFGSLLPLVPTIEIETILNIQQFLNTSQSTPIIILMTCIGISGGWFIVPLYTLLQLNSENTNRSHIIAANNVFNALFMIFSALIAILILSQGYLISDLFLLVSIASFVVLFTLKSKLKSKYFDR